MNSKIGQYSLEFDLNGYSSPTRSHKLRLWVMPTGTPAVGTPPAGVTIQKLGGTTASLQAVADQAWSYFRLAYPTAVIASSFSLWKFVTENVKDFVTAGTPAANTGATGTLTPAHQVTLTFRHALGAIGKIVMLESTATGNTQNALVANGAGTPQQRIAAYLVSADSPMLALDNSFPVTPLRDSRGENEALHKLLYR
jgi:hypothetical protein